ncbi:MAG: hypothetical protein M9924_10225 [Rhizobiaceae bacterium]|nr:hypothetical protein [Rhizobiaceae bacterium]
MLAALLGSLASGETKLALRRAKLAVFVYGFAAICLLCGLGFLVGAGYIFAAERYGSLQAALGFGAGFILLALLALLIFKLTARRRARRTAAFRKSEISALAAASGIAIASNLLRSKAGIGLIATPLVGFLAYQIIKENTRRPPPPEQD